VLLDVPAQVRARLDQDGERIKTSRSTRRKVSGQCGRLKCCLVYEEANYVEAAKLLPRAGKRVTTPDGVAAWATSTSCASAVRVYFEDQAAQGVLGVRGPPPSRRPDAARLASDPQPE
jgi:hypothetical protein